MSLHSELTAFQKRLEPALAQQLDQLESQVAAIAFTDIHKLLFSSLQNVTTGGKRIRPFLVEKLAQLYAPADVAEDWIEVCLAVELFHVFCLIHDDVIDKATARHGSDTIQQALLKQSYENREHDSAHIANSQAILMGDILFNTVYQLFTQRVAAEPHQIDLLRHFSQMVQEVCVGQIIDVDAMHKDNVGIEQITEKNLLKTAYYSIVRPLQLGALLAKETADFPILAEVGRQLGLLYQLQDDLLDLTPVSGNTGKPKFTDIVQGQPTPLTIRIAKQDPTIHTQLQTYRGKELTESDYVDLEKLLKETDAISFAKHAITQYEQSARESIQKVENAAVRDFLNDLTTFLVQRDS
jgi:geranylgeranyl diphosphate synthase type I